MKLSHAAMLKNARTVYVAAGEEMHSAARNGKVNPAIVGRFNLALEELMRAHSQALPDEPFPEKLIATHRVFVNSI